MTAQTRVTLRLTNLDLVPSDLAAAEAGEPLDVEAQFGWLAAKTLTHARTCRDEYGNRWQVIVPERLAAASIVSLRLRGPVGSGLIQRKLALGAILRGQPLTLTPSVEPQIKAG